MDGGYTSGVAVVSLLCRDGEGVVCLGIGLAIVRLCTTRAIFNQLSDTHCHVSSTLRWEHGIAARGSQWWSW